MLQWTSVPLRSVCFWSRVFCNSRFRTKTYTTPPPPHRGTAVEKLIYGSIRATGPISVSEYIQLCLSHPTEGYYMRERGDGADMFGARGDFITSPEISQVFGELVCIWFLSQWLRGAPRKPKIRLVELGPGRGTLMDDMLRVMFNWPHVKAALSDVFLVETSPIMSARQRDKLSHWLDPKPTFNLHTCESIEDVPSGLDDEFTMVVAHEFYDALPVHILEKTADGFREVLVDLQPSSTSPGQTGADSKLSSPFHFARSPHSTARAEILGALSPRFARLPTGTVFEVSSAGWRTARTMGKLISHTSSAESHDPSAEGVPNNINGAGLIIDYGAEHFFGSSFRAFKNHYLVDVFESPGLCDLTTNVDFALLKEALNDIAMTHGPIPQSKFLLQMGIHQRLAALVKQAVNEGRRREISIAGQRLIEQANQGMGSAYRVLGITSPQATNEPKNQVWPFIDEPRSQ